LSDWFRILTELNWFRMGPNVRLVKDMNSIKMVQDRAQRQTLVSRVRKLHAS
jgi:hypothetical protein